MQTVEIPGELIMSEVMRRNSVSIRAIQPVASGECIVASRDRVVVSGESIMGGAKPRRVVAGAKIVAGETVPGDTVAGKTTANGMAAETVAGMEAAKMRPTKMPSTEMCSAEMRPTAPAEMRPTAPVASATPAKC